MGSFGGLFPKLGHSSKTAHCKWKLMKIWAPGVWDSMHIGTFDLEHVKVISGSFSALFPKLDRDSKTAHRRVKWL